MESEHTLSRCGGRSILLEAEPLEPGTRLREYLFLLKRADSLLGQLETYHIHRHALTSKLAHMVKEYVGIRQQLGWYGPGKFVT